MPQNTPNQKKKKTSPIITVIYVVGIALAAGGYVFTDASGYLIPGLSPLALAAVILTYTWQHYRENRANKDGMLIPQMIILGILAAINVVSGLMQIYAAIVS
ncbi:MAG: hypothetical protein IJ449_05565 [Clostridia bacterium]|nr:hypothetical protein [Clostridia bacterium]